MGNLENVKIVCTGFEPSKEARESIIIVFKKLLEEVPYGAFIHVKLAKTTLGFEGSIDVSSIAGDFAADGSAQTAQALVDKLYNELRLELMDWKSHRFDVVARELNA